MICKNCGRSNADGTKYCIKCGKSLSSAGAPVAQPAQSPDGGIDMSRTAPVYAPPQANVFKTEENRNMNNGNYYNQPPQGYAPPPPPVPAAPVPAPAPAPAAAPDEIRLADARPSYFLAILCFFCWPMGFIIWLQWKGVSKKVSRPYGAATLISFLIGLVVIIAGGIVIGFMFNQILTALQPLLADVPFIGDWIGSLGA